MLEISPNAARPRLLEDLLKAHALALGLGEAHALGEGLPRNAPVAQVAEVCAASGTGSIEDWRAVLEHNQQGAPSINILALRGRGLRLPGQMQSLHFSRWPDLLKTWWRLVEAERERQATEEKQREPHQPTTVEAEHQAAIQAEHEQRAKEATIRDSKLAEYVLRAQEFNKQRAQAIDQERAGQIADAVVAHPDFPRTSAAPPVAKTPGVEERADALLAQHGRRPDELLRGKALARVLFTLTKDLGYAESQCSGVNSQKSRYPDLKDLAPPFLLRKALVAVLRKGAATDPGMKIDPPKPVLKIAGS